MINSAERVFFASESDFRNEISLLFEKVKQELEALMPGSDVQHVGSTAVPGSLTKGDLDVQVRVNASQFSFAKEILCEIYTVNDGGFVASDAISFERCHEKPSVGIHLTVIDGSCDIQWKFRDLMLSSASLRQEYDDLKYRFEGGSMEEYRNAKAVLVERFLYEEKFR